MGLWSSAVRGEGMRVGRNDHGLIVTLVVLITITRTVFRYFTGRPLLGPAHRRTDAEFLKPGTRKLSNNDRTPSAWCFLPEWKRAVVRVGALLVLLAALWWPISGGPFDSSPVHDTVSGLALLVVLDVGWLGGARLVRRVRQFAHQRRFARPLRDAVAPILGVSPREVTTHLPRTVPTQTQESSA